MRPVPAPSTRVASIDPRTRRSVGLRLARRLPLALTLLRAALAPLVVGLAAWAPDRVALGTCVTLAFVSDVFDGIVARRLGIATAGLRRLDSIADSIFYAAALYAAWRLYPAEIVDHAVPLAILGALEAVRYAFDLKKFRREASYHMWSSKAWGVALFVGFVALLGFGQGGPFVAWPIAIGIVADLEGLAISVVLPTWRADVPSLRHAWALRRQARAAT